MVYDKRITKRRNNNRIISHLSCYFMFLWFRDSFIPYCEFRHSGPWTFVLIWIIIVKNIYKHSENTEPFMFYLFTVKHYNRFKSCKTVNMSHYKIVENHSFLVKFITSLIISQFHKFRQNTDIFCS